MRFITVLVIAVLALANDVLAQAGWQTTFIDKPQFNGEPLPPQYVGKSLDELLALGYSKMALPSMTPVNFRWADSADADTLGDIPSSVSPELRGHPLLDQLVLDLNQDPIALAAYVQNEIALTNAYQAQSSLVDGFTIGADQIIRGALGTYLEKQGSPWEQCALLVHLLRRAGYPAAYVYNTYYSDNRGVWMLARDVQHMLGVEISDTIDETSLIRVSFPWVAVYTTKTGTGGEWKQLFPWIKDTLVEEGLNHYDYLPVGYASGRDWMGKYLTNDSAINNLIVEGGRDTPGELFLRYIDQQAASSGLSFEDFGVRKYDRKRQYSQWGDFPKPLIIGQKDSDSWTGTLSVKTNDLKDAGDTSKFATMQVSVQNTSGANLIATQTMKLCDLHNRRFYAYYKPGTNKVALQLSPFDDDANLTQGTFSSSTVIAGQYKEINDPGVALQIKVDIAGLNPSVNFSGTEFTRPIDVNSLVAICFNSGHVTKDMLDVHARKFRQLEAQTTTPPMQDYVGVTMHTVGMTYWANMIPELEKIRGLHKIYTYFDYGLCLASITPEAGSGNTQWRIPRVDIPFKINLLGNSSIHPNSSQTQAEVQQDDYFLEAGVASANEHYVLNSFFGKENGISTVQLLRLANERHAGTAGNNGQGFYSFTRSEFAAANSDPAYAALRADAGDLWTAAYDALQIGVSGYQASGWEMVYFTPFDIEMDAPSGSTPAYDGMALLYVVPSKIGALIDGQASGGVGETFESDIFATTNFPNLSFSFNLDGHYELIDFGSLDFGLLVASLGSDSVSQYFTNITLGNLFVDSFITTSWTVAFGQLGYDPSSDYGDIGATIYSDGWLGDVSWHNLGGLGNSFVSDPVNVINGEFYIDAVDLTLPGPLPLKIRRNYGSQNEALNILGYGWKFSLTPYINVTQDDDLVYAADLDGSVVAYRKVGGSSPTRWEPTASDNPLLNNYNGGRIGGTDNPFNAYVLRTTESTDVIYTVYRPDGCTARYRVRSFPVTSGGSTITRERPYLEQWADSMGNAFTFSYYETAADVEYGQLKRISSTNGSYLGFRYNATGLVKEIFTHDGRRVSYDYDNYGDLVKVILPDNATISYDYKILTDPDQGNAPYSTHLLITERKPDGRLIKNIYDPLYDPKDTEYSQAKYRRVAEQWGTVGVDLVPLKFAEYEYNPAGDPWVTAGFDVTYVHSDVRPDKGRLTTTYVHKNGLYHHIADAKAVGFSPTNTAIDHVISNEWYVGGETNGYQRSVKSIRDKRGLTTQYEYDAKGSLSKATKTGDLTGDGTADTASTYFYYDTDRYLLHKVIGPAPDSGLPQRVVYYTYPTISGGATSGVDPTDSNYYLYAYLPQKIATYQVLNPALNSSEPSSADLISQTVNSYGQATAGGLQAHGLLKKLASSSPLDTDDKTETSWQFDARGYPTSRTQKTFTATADVVTQYEYNQKGELTKETDQAGRICKYEYDLMGRLKSKERYASSSAPAAIQWKLTYYNQNGEVTWEDGTHHFPEDYVFRDYDGAGRVIAEVKWRSQAKADGTGLEEVPGQGSFLGQSITYYEYDGFGNLVSVIDPRGYETSLDYSALGELNTKTVALGTDDEGSESFLYEPGGLVRSHVNFKGGETVTTYSDLGNQTSRSTPDGRSEHWEYYLDGRVKTYTLSNGAVWTFTYDDKLLKETRVLAKGGNTLAKQVRIFDTRGNEVNREEFADASTSYVFETDYDGLGRVVRKAGPPAETHPDTAETVSSQQVTTYTYTFGGTTNPFTVEAITGAVKQVEVYNARGEVGQALLINNTTSTIEDETVYTYADTVNLVISKRILRNGSTSAQTLVTEHYADNAGQPVLTRFADGKFVRQVHDKAGNLTSRFDELNLETQYTYDARNRLRTTIKPDASIVTLGYDAGDNLISREMPGGITWQADYDTANRTSWEELVGTDTSVSRRIAYAYYSSGANIGLLSTRVENGATSEAVTHSFGYDDVMRVTGITSSGGGYTPVVQSRAFDWRSVIVGMTRASPGATGLIPSVKTTRQVDGYGQIFDELTQTGTGLGVDSFTATANASHLIQRWDTAGRRSTLRQGPSISKKGTWTPWFKYGYFAGGQPKSIDNNSASSYAWRLDYFYEENGILSQAGFASFGPATAYYAQSTNTIAPPYANSQHDVRGRLVARDIFSQIGGQTTIALSESFPRADDGKLTSYSVQRTTGASTSWATLSETRNYGYDAQNRRLDSETYKPSPTASGAKTLSYTFDSDNLGVRVEARNDTDNTNVWNVPAPTAGGLDAFKRVISENEHSGLFSFLAQGSTVGPGKFSLLLGEGASPSSWEQVATVHPDPNYGSGAWSVPLSLSAGQYTLKASASPVWSGSTHVAEQTSTFTITASGQDRVRANAYDKMGRLLSRSWAAGQVTQTFTWDATGKLIKVVQADSRTTGRQYPNYVWKATYDPLGRRIATSYQDENNPPFNPEQNIIKSWYDPEVEFLEVAVEVSDTRYWKVHGPDLTAGYGSYQGVGGLEVIVDEATEQYYPTLDDAFGNIVGFLNMGSVTNAGDDSLIWVETQVGGYGPLPGHQMQPLEKTGDLLKSLAWQSRRIDPTGFFLMGARYYDPVTGAFLSTDPLGHAECMDLYSYADGDPINSLDPSGRGAQLQFNSNDSVNPVSNPWWGLNTGDGLSSFAGSGLQGTSDITPDGISASSIVGRAFSQAMDYDAEDFDMAFAARLAVLAKEAGDTELERAAVGMLLGEYNSQTSTIFTKAGLYLIAGGLKAPGKPAISGGLVDDALVAELKLSGIKITPSNVVATSRNASGQVVFLESGNAASGLQHIIAAHGDDFARVGISSQQIPEVVTQAVTRGRFVGYQGGEFGRPIYEIVVNGRIQHIAVTVGNNGYIVGANPTTLLQ